MSLGLWMISHVFGIFSVSHFDTTLLRGGETRANILAPMITRGIADWIAEELGNARAERVGGGNAVIRGKMKEEQWN